MSQTLRCPSCEAPLELAYRFSKVVVCRYCHQTSMIGPAGLDPLAPGNGLVDTPSVLEVGAVGHIHETPFQVLGRLRFAYPGGLWDEWLLLGEDDQITWLQEDDGTFVAFRMMEMPSGLPLFDELSVGSQVTIDGNSMLVTEKTRAMIAGGEGELPFVVIPGADVNCVDLTGAGAVYALEYLPEETTFSFGRPVPADQLKVDRTAVS